MLNKLKNTIRTNKPLVLKTSLIVGGTIVGTIIAATVYSKLNHIETDVEILSEAVEETLDAVDTALNN